MQKRREKVTVENIIEAIEKKMEGGITEFYESFSKLEAMEEEDDEMWNN